MVQGPRFGSTLWECSDPVSADLKTAVGKVFSTGPGWVVKLRTPSN